MRRRDIDSQTALTAAEEAAVGAGLSGARMAVASSSSGS